VREQFRIAAGLRLRWTEDPQPRGHAIEFRINGEDPGRGFLPAPGALTGLRWPAGPGVRVDAGVEAGNTVGGAFDSLLAKLVVWGATRAEALQRARRALDETIVDGVATVLPFDRAVVRDPAFVEEPFRVHTRWIETEWAADVPPFTGGSPQEEPAPRETIVVEVSGKRLEVSLPAHLGMGPTAPVASKQAPRRGGGRRGVTAAGGDALASPMQGTIVKVAVADGDQVSEGDLIVVLEAMKMEQPVNAHKAGTISGLTTAVGEVVPAGAVVCSIV
jgi:acetyl-CoA/propionyl-CoA carboxylase, biotin carboxylase, biotin carboxyl carrier protein